MKKYTLARTLGICGMVLLIQQGGFAISNAADETPDIAQPVVAAPLRIATVDMQELFKQYHRTNEAQKQINIERARIQKDNNERLARIREHEENLIKIRKQLDDPSINDSKKQELYKEFQNDQQTGTALDRERREFLQRRNTALNEKMVQRMKGILEEIRKLVEEKAKVDNFDYVFDKSGLSSSQVPILLYAKDSTDITTSLLERLNREAPNRDSVTDLADEGTVKAEDDR